MTVVTPCPPATPEVRGVVEFDATEFKGDYPAFATVDNGLLQADFDIATLFLNNSCCSVVKDANKRQVLLYLLTAHIAALLQGANGQPPSGIVGRVDSAREGSVSVSASYAAEMSMSEAYFSQTQWGAAFWQATVAYRMGGYYTPGPAQACIGGLPGYGAPFPFGSGGNGCC
jgi:hypothetical protein